MAVTFEEARDIVARALKPTWRNGTFYVAPEGSEDDQSWLVTAGARESIVDGDTDYDLMDAPALFVDKETGELTKVPFIQALSRLRSMKPTKST